MKTLRIIDQTLSGAEQRRNISLEGDDYDVIMKIVTTEPEHCENHFKLAMKQYYSEVNGQSDETIIGFVAGKNKLHPIRELDVAFIVNDEGKTVERIFGHYKKY